MSYKRISIRFNLDIEDERNAWELLHSSSCGPINKEVIDSINTAHKLSTLEALLRKVISEELRNISLHIPFLMASIWSQFQLSLYTVASIWSHMNRDTFFGLSDDP